jgi:cytochrome c-type biogenesis protein CcmH/NrfF
MPNCEGEAAQMAQMRAYIAQGQNREQVLASFVADQGPSALMVPPNEGFNRTAWVFPAAVGAVGLVLVGLTARRWTRRPRQADDTGATPIDSELNARLDDELRDLD